MLATIKEAGALYKKNFWRILLVGITIILPVQIIYTILVNYVSLPFILFNIPLWPTIFQSVFMLISVFVLLIPLISIVVQDMRANEVKVGQLYLDTLKYAFFVYMISIPVSILTTVGLLLLIIPGLVLLVLFIGIPFAKVIEDDKLKATLKKSIAFGKENFLHICSLLLLFAVADFIGTYLFSLMAIVTTGLMAITNWAIMIFNMLLLPLFVFALGKQYMIWNGEADLIHEKEYVHQLNQYR